jgi:hypothetical protein
MQEGLKDIEFLLTLENMKAGDKNEKEMGKNNENKTDETGKKTKIEDNMKNTTGNTVLTSTQIFTGICEPSAINTVWPRPGRRPTCATAAWRGVLKDAWHQRPSTRLGH